LPKQLSPLNLCLAFFLFGCTGPEQLHRAKKAEEAEKSRRTIKPPCFAELQQSSDSAICTNSFPNIWSKSCLQISMPGIQIKTIRAVGVADKHTRCAVASLPKTNVIHTVISL